MRLTEALRLNTNYKTRLAKIKEIAKDCTFVQEGDKPPFDVIKLLQIFKRLSGEHANLSYKISMANATFMVTVPLVMFNGVAVTKAEDMCLSAAMTYLSLVRDLLLLLKWSILGSLYRENLSSYREKELRWIRVIDVQEYQVQYEYFTELERLIEIAINEANWNCQVDVEVLSITDLSLVI